MECKHKWVTLEWHADDCGCCGDLSAVCTICEETINDYLSYWEIEKLELDEDEDDE